MKKLETIKRLTTENSSPGKLMKLLSLIILVSLLQSCGNSNEEANLTLLEWAGYEDEKFHPEYNAKYGKQPDYTFFADEEDALQRMRTGYQVDLIHLCTEQVTVARDAGLIKPIDISRIPRWDDITPYLLEIEGVKVDGQYWFVPWEWGYSTVAYNPELIEIENATYKIFIDPRFKGKTALPLTIGVNLLIAGVIGDWANPLDPTEAEMNTAPEIFTKMLQNARFIWSDSTQLEQAWVGGDVGISYVFGSASRRMKNTGIPIKVIEPLQTWMCGLSIGSNTGVSDEQIYDYINAMLDPLGGVALFDEYGYGHGNGKTVDLLDPARIEGTGIDNPREFFKRGIYTAGLPPEKKGRLIQMWFEAQAGLH